MTHPRLSPHRITADGADLAAWHREGSDPKLWMAMVHGAGVDHREFLPMIDRIDATWNIVVFDMRGHGASRLHDGAVATIDTVIDDLAVILTYADRNLRTDGGTWLLVGHSFGGNVAQELSHRRSDRVHALVTIGSPGQHRTLRRGELSAMRFAGHLYRVVPWPLFARFGGSWSSHDPDTRAYVRECLIATGRAIYLQLGLSGFESVHAPPPSDLPTLHIRGELDMPQALDAIFDEVVQANSAAARAIIPAVGHQPMQDAPDALALELNRYLRGAGGA
ncbi:alpha/beta fold hydrolase [Leucobacter musarum]|uniref:alpha/beta fold hydrolase n=1 Tax=Leucobacter musarum TaxID=1930747 RepID=UPI0006A7CC7A|nr:alpha/beta hydrolase [Leucobacter musarum]